MVSLPTTVPSPDDDLNYRTLIQDIFTYALAADSDTWDAWTDAVDDDVTYQVYDIDVDNKA